MKQKRIMWIATGWISFLCATSLFIYGCTAPPLRHNDSADHFVQGSLPKYLDLLVVIDSSKSFTGHRKALRDSMTTLMNELQSGESKFRIAVTSGSARAFTAPPRNQVQTLINSFGFSDGSPAFGLDGSFATSGNNTAFVTEADDATTKFIQSVDKINALSNLLITTGDAHYSSSSWPLSYFYQYYGSNYFSINLNLIPGPTYSLGNNTGSILNADDERYLEAIKMATLKVPGIFPPRSDVAGNEVPLAVMIVKDTTADQSDYFDNPSAVGGVEAAKSLIRTLRQHTVSGHTESNVKLFSLVQDTNGNIAQLTQDLHNENNGVTGQVFALDASGSTVAAAVEAVKATLEQPQTVFCLHQAANPDTLVVRVNGVVQHSPQDYILDLTTSCVEFQFVPAEGAQIDFEY